MGSLDPLLVSVAFRVWGESVLSIRLVQSILYLGTVVTTAALGGYLSGDCRVALSAGLLMAVPPVVMSLYTTISLGGYGEILLIGNVLLLVGYAIYRHHRYSWRYWLALGALTGLGWWTNNLIIAYLLPVGLYVLIGLLSRWHEIQWSLLIRALIVCLAAFFAFSAPWWLYNLNHDWESLRFLLSGSSSIVALSDKLLGLLLFGIPTMLGLRYPWQTALWSPWPLTLLAVALYLVMLVPTVVAALRKPGAMRFLWLMIAGFAVIFVVSGFGIDATGRYLLPLIAPLAILIGLQQRNRWTWLITSGLLSANVLATVIAIRNVPPGLTPQFNPVTDFPNADDQAVIDFLQAHGGQRGYATYWATYRLAFLSGEAIILSPVLPYRPPYDFSGPDRYPLYTAQVVQADRPVLLTANLPELDVKILERFKMIGVESWKMQRIGPYTIFYDLSRRIMPTELRFGPTE